MLVDAERACRPDRVQTSMLGVVTNPCSTNPTVLRRDVNLELSAVPDPDSWVA